MIYWRQINMKLLVLLVLAVWEVNCQYQTRIPTKAEYNEVRNYFLNQFANGNRGWVAKLLRLAFHDSSTYVHDYHVSADAAERKIGGGSHLCMWENNNRGAPNRVSHEFNDADNNNLQSWIDNLQEAFGMFGVGGTRSFELSRADIIQIGSAAGIQFGSDSQHDTRIGADLSTLVLLNMDVKVGRKDCEDVDTVAIPVPAPYDGGLMDGALGGVMNGRLPAGELFNGTDGPTAFENFGPDENQADTLHPLGPVICGTDPTSTCNCGPKCWDELLLHMRGWIGRQGFGPDDATKDEAIVALLGAHTYGGVHLQDSRHNTGTWTEDSLVFDGGYYKNLLGLGWTLEISDEADNPRHTAVNGERIMLTADLNLGFQPTMKDIAKSFQDESLWIPKFEKYYNQMIENGHQGISFATCQTTTAINGFTVRYSLDDRDSSNEQITIIVELDKVVDQWFAAGFSPTGSMDGSDVVVHNRDGTFTERVVGNQVSGVDRTSSNLIYAEYWSMNNKTALQITRPLAGTGNGQTIDKQNVHVVMAYAADTDPSDTLDVTAHGPDHRDFITIDLTHDCECTSNTDCNDGVECTDDTCDIGVTDICKHTPVDANCGDSACTPFKCLEGGCQQLPKPCPTTCDEMTDELIGSLCAPTLPGPPTPPSPFECLAQPPLGCNDNRVCTDDACGAAGTAFENHCRSTNNHIGCSVVGEMCDGIGDNPDASGCTDNYFEWEFGIASANVPQITVIAGGSPAIFRWDTRIDGREHTVIELSQDDMENCNVPANIIGPTRRGTVKANGGSEEAISFTGEEFGEHFYSCEVLWPEHCDDHQMKAKVLVLEQWGCQAENDACLGPMCEQGVCVKANDGLLGSDALGCDIFSGAPPQNPCAGTDTPFCIPFTGCSNLPETCTLHNDQAWCTHPTDCGIACTDTCQALGMEPLSDPAVWFAAQDETAECSELSLALGMDGFMISSYTYGCMEENAASTGRSYSVSGAPLLNFGPLLCSSYESCPDRHLAETDNELVHCDSIDGGRLAICPCGDGLINPQCAYETDGTPCSDGDPDTMFEACQSGVCTGGVPLTCVVVGYQTWCWHPLECGHACDSTCAALGLNPLSDTDIWFSLQDTAEECTVLASALGLASGVAQGNTYSCLEESAGPLSREFDANGSPVLDASANLMCSSLAQCPVNHLTTMLEQNIPCANSGKLSICPCGEGAFDDPCIAETHPEDQCNEAGTCTGGVWTILPKADGTSCNDDVLDSWLDSCTAGVCAGVTFIGWNVMEGRTSSIPQTCQKCTGNNGCDAAMIPFVTDGNFEADGSAFDTNSLVWCNAVLGDPSFVFDLDGTFLVHGFAVQKECGESLTLTHRNFNNGQMSSFVTVDAAGCAPGLVTSHGVFDRINIDPFLTDRIGFSASGGDGSASVSELQIFGVVAYRLILCGSTQFDFQARLQDFEREFIVSTDCTQIDPDVTAIMVSSDGGFAQLQALNAVDYIRTRGITVITESSISDEVYNYLTPHGGAVQFQNISGSCMNTFRPWLRADAQDQFWVDNPTTDYVGVGTSCGFPINDFPGITCLGNNDQDECTLGYYDLSCVSRLYVAEIDWAGPNGFVDALDRDFLFALLKFNPAFRETCQMVNGQCWCTHPTDCGLACNDVCGALDMVPWCDSDAWFNAQNTAGECQDFAAAFGFVAGVDVGDHLHGCLEEQLGADARTFDANGHPIVDIINPLLCSTNVGCPTNMLTNVDELGVDCASGGRLGICPCNFDHPCDCEVCTALDQCHDVGTCDWGVCSDPEKLDFTTCDDIDDSTLDDVCTSGICAGTPDPCYGIVCVAKEGGCYEVGTCTNGVCSEPQSPNLTPCNDGDDGTNDPDMCIDGVCLGLVEGHAHVLLCGTAAYDFTARVQPDLWPLILIDEDCTFPLKDTVTDIMVSRSGLAALQALDAIDLIKTRGVDVFTEFGISDEVYNYLIPDGDRAVQNPDNSGGCLDTFRPLTRVNDQNKFWVDYPSDDFIGVGTYCGYPLDNFPGLTCLGNNVENTCNLGYIDLSCVSRLWTTETDWQDGNGFIDALDRAFLMALVTFTPLSKEVCAVVNGQCWCTHPTDCGLGCNEVCGSIEMAPWCDPVAWLEVQNTIAKCQVFADELGFASALVGSYTHGCLEETSGAATRTYDANGHPIPDFENALLCSNSQSCPNAILTEIDEDGVECSLGGRLAICPCNTMSLCECITCTALSQCHDIGTCTNGECSNPTKVDATVCNDTNPDTNNEKCYGGQCMDLCEFVTCSALDDCHDVGVCIDGQCTDPEKQNGATCNDNDNGTDPDTCQSGVCNGTPIISPTGLPDSCTLHNGQAWCTHPTSCGKACQETCEALGMLPLSDLVLWFEEQNTQAECEALAASLGMAGAAGITSYSYGCAEEQTVSSNRVYDGDTPLLDPTKNLLCSNLADCPASLLTIMDNLGVDCDPQNVNEGRLSICPCGEGLLHPQCAYAPNYTPCNDFDGTTVNDFCLDGVCTGNNKGKLMLCGTASFDFEVIMTAAMGDDFTTIVGSCDCLGDASHIMVSRSGVESFNTIAGSQWVLDGGVVITEYSTSDEVYNYIFDETAVQGPTGGGCIDSPIPFGRENLDDPFWVQYGDRADFYGDGGACGSDIREFPFLTPLGTWEDDRVMLGYRQYGLGRVWFLESDWQDGEYDFTQPMLEFFRALLLHAGKAPGGNPGECVSQDPCYNIECPLVSQCHDSVCADGLCVNSTKADGHPCDDHNPDNPGGDVCLNGVCIGLGGIVDCTATPSGQLCQGCVDVGNDLSVCESASGDCGSCSQNACLHSPDYVGYDQMCIGDPCSGVVCSALSQCHDVGTCIDGECANPVKQDGTLCDDYDGSTDSDQCLAGVCEGTPVTGGVYVGQYNIFDGVRYNENPPAYTCLDACELLFGPVPYGVYECSTTPDNIDNMGWYQEYADSSTCSTPLAEDYNLPYPNYSTSGAISAYVGDHSGICLLVNYCFHTGLPPTCHVHNGQAWCTHPEQCGVACQGTCEALGMLPLSDSNVWFEAQNTQAECDALAASIGMNGGQIGGYTHGCCEEQTHSSSRDYDANNSPILNTALPLLCSTSTDCPNGHLTDMDQIGNSCDFEGRLSICPCGDGLLQSLCDDTVCSALDNCHDVGVCYGGLCSDPEKQDGTSCDDYNSETEFDQCTAGECIGTPIGDLCTGVVCYAFDDCHDIGVCTNGVCSDPPKQDGTDCDDGFASTHTDKCTAGVCSGTPFGAGHYIGSYVINGGVSFNEGPPTYSCIEACELHFGVPSNGAYQCSTSLDIIDHMGWYQEYGTTETCNSPLAEDFDSPYEFYSTSGAISAYVIDHGASCELTNYCFSSGFIDCTDVATGFYCQGCVDVNNDGSVCKSSSDECGSCDENVCKHSPVYVGYDQLCADEDPCDYVQCVALDQCHDIGTCVDGQCSTPGKQDGTFCDDGYDSTHSDMCQAGVCIGIPLGYVDCTNVQSGSYCGQCDVASDMSICRSASGDCGVCLGTTCQHSPNFDPQYDRPCPGAGGLPPSCTLHTGQAWCTHPTQCGMACQDTCEALGMLPLSHPVVWLEAQNTNALCAALAETLGMNGYSLSSYSYGCLEEYSTSSARLFDANGSPLLDTSQQLLCSTVENCPNDHIYEMDNEGTNCDQNGAYGRLAICPCGDGLLHPQCAYQLNYTPCNDGDASTVNDFCLNGVCVGNDKGKLMLCGSSSWDSFEQTMLSVVGDDFTSIDEECTCLGDASHIMATRSGGASSFDSIAGRQWVIDGGVVITEYSNSDEVYNLLFNDYTAVQGANGGGCSDSPIPFQRENLGDPFWVQYADRDDFYGDGGACGYDIGGFPLVTPLGSWADGKISFGYRNLGLGRVWFLEADWQDGQDPFTVSQLDFFRAVLLHAGKAPGGNPGECIVQDPCYGVQCIPESQCHDSVCTVGDCAGSTKTDGHPCDDGDDSNGDDVCLAGNCVGLGVNLCDGVVCTALGECHYAGVCNVGICSNPQAIDDTLCDGGVCYSGQCIPDQPGVVVDCSYVNPGVYCEGCDNPANDLAKCISSAGVCGTCVESSCRHSPQYGAQYDKPCDDLVDCTAVSSGFFCEGCDGNDGTICQSSSGDCGECSSSSCLHSPSYNGFDHPCPGDVGCSVDGQCEDFDSCTTTSCVNEACNTVVHQNLPGCRVCSFNSNCEDYDPCTQDTCGGDGYCNNVYNQYLPDCNNPCNGVVCSAVDTCHYAGSCIDGSCTTPMKQDGQSCDDDNGATKDDICDGGLCIGIPIGGITDCTNVASGIPCQDCIDEGNGGALCQSASLDCGSCIDDACLHSPGYPQYDQYCQDPCDGVVCEPIGQCYLPGVCTDGSCSIPMKSFGTPCDDGKEYTDPDYCDGGFCTGTLLTDPPTPPEFVDCTHAYPGEVCQGCIDAGNNNELCKSKTGKCGSCYVNTCAHEYGPAGYDDEYDQLCPDEETEAPTDAPDEPCGVSYADCISDECVENDGCGSPKARTFCKPDEVEWNITLVGTPNKGPCTQNSPSCVPGGCVDETRCTTFTYEVTVTSEQTCKPNEPAKDLSHWGIGAVFCTMDDLNCFRSNDITVNALSLKDNCDPPTAGQGYKVDVEQAKDKTYKYTFEICGEVDVCDSFYFVKGGTRYAFGDVVAPKCHDTDVGVGDNSVFIVDGFFEVCAEQLDACEVDSECFDLIAECVEKGGEDDCWKTAMDNAGNTPYTELAQCYIDVVNASPTLQISIALVVLLMNVVWLW